MINRTSTRLRTHAWLIVRDQPYTHTYSIEQHAGHASSALVHNQVSLIIVGGYLPGGVVNEK